MNRLRRRRTLPSSLLLTATAAFLTFGSGSALATIVFTDDFEDGNVNGWTRMDTGGGFAPSHVTDGSFGSPTNGALKGVTATGFKGTSARFSSISLSIGQTLRLSFDFRYDTAVGLADSFLQVGLANFDSPTAGTQLDSDKGYFMTVGTGINQTFQAVSDKGGEGPFFYPPTGSDLEVLGNSPGLTPNADNLVHSYRLELEVLDQNQIRVSGYFDNQSVSGIHLYNEDLSRLDFNGLGIQQRGALPGSGDRPFHLDNVVVTIVPEPSNLALLLLGGVGFLRRRR